VLRSYFHASAASDLRLMHSSLLSILNIPRNSLLRARGGKKKRALRSLASQLRSASQSFGSGSSPHALPSASSDPTSSRVLRARTLLQQGHLSRAVHSLFQSDLPPIDDNVIATLKSLHPPPSDDAPPVPDHAPTLQQVDLLVLSRLICRSLANGAAPAGSGWTGDLLKALVDDADCLAALGALVSDIINGRLIGSSRDLLLSSLLVPVAKSSGGTRPIAMGECFYKLACLYNLL
jgi:hypothetical protein